MTRRNVFIAFSCGGDAATFLLHAGGARLAVAPAGV